MRRKHEVLVAGGGPVGLFAALSLHERDVQVAVVDAEWERPIRSHACGLHPATLRALSELGLLPALLPRGHTIDRLSVYRGHELAGQVSFADLGEPFPHVLALR
ncbi:MAG TPA: FAD-dependent monooxygenase, partial [Polyangiaceae bacterium]|nr:FAD-dependent monooxygenase [Polyangiaceae bacterium]